MEKVLIVDDDDDLRTNLSRFLRGENFEATCTGKVKEAIRLIKKEPFDLVLLDMRLPDMNGIEALRRFKKINSSLGIIMLTAFGDVTTAVVAMKEGAFDYIAKPFNNMELILAMKKALKLQYLSREVENLSKKLGMPSSKEITLGESPAIKHVLKQVRLVAPTDMTVILQGESGSGKELIAHMIHAESKRNNATFVAVDSGAIPETLVESELFGYEKGAFTGADDIKEGKFEKASGGTLFLDEVGNLSNSVQMKLLRCLEERRVQHLGGKKDIKVDVRIIAATNVDLREAVRKGGFRDDLFHRLNEFCINLPPLRERKEDIPVLADYFLQDAKHEFNKVRIKSFSKEAIKFLLKYTWPGNVRELKNVVKKAVLISDGDEIHLWHLAVDNASSAVNINPNISSLGTSDPYNFREELDKGASFHELARKAAREIEERIIKEALAQVGGNKSKAAKLLKIDRMTLYAKLRNFKL